MNKKCKCGERVTTIANGVEYCTHCYFRNLNSVISIAVARVNEALRLRELEKYKNWQNYY